MFRQAIIRPPAANFADGLTTAELGRPNFALALQQHAAYCDALEACGLTLTRLGADERFPDSTFVEDTAVIVVSGSALAQSETHVLANGRATAPKSPASSDRGSSESSTTVDYVAILTRPGAASRAGEVESIAGVLDHLKPRPQLHSIQKPGTLDGGDICEAERETDSGAQSHFFIGVSERTNDTGAQQLAELLSSYGCTSSPVDIRGLPNILHLKSGLTYLGDNRLVVIDALANHEAFHGFELVRVSPSEEYAANCVRVNNHVLVAAGFPRFERTLQALGYQTITLEMSEFQKMDGGLSCLSLRF